MSCRSLLARVHAKAAQATQRRTGNTGRGWCVEQGTPTGRRHEAGARLLTRFRTPCNASANEISPAWRRSSACVRSRGAVRPSMTSCSRTPSRASSRLSSRSRWSRTVACARWNCTRRAMKKYSVLSPTGRWKLLMVPHRLVARSVSRSYAARSRENSKPTERPRSSLGLFSAKSGVGLDKASRRRRRRRWDLGDPSSWGSRRCHTHSCGSDTKRPVPRALRSTLGTHCR
jgi:hypothetical protein